MVSARRQDEPHLELRPHCRSDQPRRTLEEPAYDDGSLALLHRLEKGTYWDDEVERARSAIALADRREVRAARTIRQPLDTCETDPEPASPALQCSLGDLGVGRCHSPGLHP